jgi:endogenous inhibitor of DNA gyrase (YacG/DUF329 family)
MANDNIPKGAKAGASARPQIMASDPAAEEAVGKPCPICRKPSLRAYRPFCSKRCADLDLSRWLNGVYAVPAAETGEDDDEAER